MKGNRGTEPKPRATHSLQAENIVDLRRAPDQRPEGMEPARVLGGYEMHEEFPPVFWTVGRTSNVPPVEPGTHTLNCLQATQNPVWHKAEGEIWRREKAVEASGKSTNRGVFWRAWNRKQKPDRFSAACLQR